MVEEAKRQKTEQDAATPSAQAAPSTPSTGAERAQHVHDLTSTLIKAVDNAQAALKASSSTGQKDDSSERDPEEECELATATAHIAFEMAIDAFSAGVGRSAAPTRQAAIDAYSADETTLTTQPDLFKDVLLEKVFGDMLTHAEAQSPRLLLPFRPQLVGLNETVEVETEEDEHCLLYTSPSPRD